MMETEQVPAGYDASGAEVAEVLAWFERYDALVAAGDLEAMADVAHFPLNEVTDDAAGHAVVGPCDRERFLAQMRETVGSAGEVSSRSTRHPVFLSAALVFVVTDSVITAGGEDHHLRYGDLLVRTEDGWKFQTMVAGGWAGQM
ncbi:nuclear transport factor 2 family protein [Actinomycetospora atypica]|uniref:Nuclear transport factor 2 family protein n=1 Tax=Actinomycetospora atypica TaxID=1290095 RepID=A0ABV9YQV5_9PSEU